MYACDDDDLDLLGKKQLFDPAPPVQTQKRMQTIATDCQTHLSDYPEQAMVRADDLKFVTDYLVYNYDESSTEKGGDSVSDMFYYCRCLLLCCADVQIRDMSSLGDVHELYTRVQLLGSNHTRARFDQLDSHMEVVRLEQRCASLIVYCLGEAPKEIMKKLEVVPPIDPLLQATVDPLRYVPDPKADIAAADLTEEERKRKAQEEEGEAKDEDDGFVVLPSSTEVADDEGYDVNEGAYWHTDKESLIGGFVSMACRVFRHYWLQKQIFDKYPICSKELMPMYSESQQKSFTDWLVRMCLRENSDSSVKDYRNLIYEHWLPVGSQQETLRSFSSKYDFLQALNLLEQQLGVDSATSLANIARSKTKLVSEDPTHPVYEFLLLSQFSYVMTHKCATPFLNEYYIMPGELGRHHRRLDVKKSWGRPRLPILLRLMRGWWIHDDGKWLPCKNLQDALLLLMMRWMGSYNGELATRVHLGAFVQQLTTPEIKED